MGLHGERDIVERGEIGKQRGDLKRARQPEPASSIGGMAGDVAAVEADAAAIGCNLAAQQRDQRALAGAVRPDHGVKFSGCQVERDRVRGDHAAEALGQAFDLQQRRTHGALLLKSPAIPPRK